MSRFCFRFLQAALGLTLYSALLLLSSHALADHPASDDDALPGHSSHGDAFDDGPRQAARLMPGVAGPSFNASTKNVAALRFIDQGISQLHGFWYWEAERSFRQAALLDPDCAIAYWGMAMANTNNEKRATEFIRLAMKHRVTASPREQQYIDILSAYYEALDKEKNGKPDAKKEEAKPAEKSQEEDTNAKSEESCDADSKPETKEPAADDQNEAELRRRQEELKKQEAALQKKAAAAAKREADAKKKADESAKKQAKKNRYLERQKGWEKLSTEFPDDVHARAFLALQLWQDNSTVPIQSYQAIDALLDQVFKLAPDHPAQHYRIHLWDNKRPQNAITAAASCGQTAPGIAHLWHMPGHTYSKLKRFEDATYHQEASARVDHAYMLTDGIMPYQIHNYAHNNEWCTRSMHTIGHAHDALTLALNMLEIPRHPKQNKPFEKSTVAGYGPVRFYEVAVKYELWLEILRLSDTTYLRDPDLPEVDELRRRRYLAVAAAALDDQRVVTEQIAWFEQYEKDLRPSSRAKPQVDTAGGSLRATPANQTPTSCAVIRETALKVAEHAQPTKTRTKRELADLQRRVTESLNHIRGMQAQTAGEPKQALDFLKKVGNLPKEQLAHAYSLADDHKQAVKLAREAVKANEQAVLPRAALVEALWLKGEREEAGQEFQTLRKLAATADTDLPVFNRLGEVMTDQESPLDWRANLNVPKDIGIRPALDSLGPLRWTPADAPNWELADSQGNQHSLAGDYAGQPVVVIFYLGHGCLHCVEQLNIFAPLVKEYEAAGIKLVAISNDSPKKLRESIKLFNDEGTFPITLLTDETKSAFRDYRCHDDFENRAMHGTFLIDGRGRIRWQDIGPEPFSDARFLLKESQRLLALPE